MSLPSTPSSSPNSRPGPWLAPRRLIWLLLLLLMGPLLVAEIPREIARWKLAAALTARDAGQKERAYAELEEVFRWFPDNPHLLVQRAQWRWEDGQSTDALADCRRMLDHNGDDIFWLKVHSLFLQNIGRYAEAVDDWKKIDQLSLRKGRAARTEALNGLAYAQALAQVELDQALKNANDALESVPNAPSILDTRGFVLYRKGEYRAALADLNASIRMMEVAVRAYTPLAQRSDKSSSFLYSRPKAILETEHGSDPSRVLHLAAVIHSHRRFVLLALGKEKEAEADLGRVRELIGREPDETLF